MVSGTLVHARMTVLPIIYGRVMTTYKSQGREFEQVCVHAAGFMGEDNQLLTAVSRAKGCPWSGTLKVVGIRLLHDGQKQTDLLQKMKPYPKSLLMAKLLGKDVPQYEYDRARARVLAADPNWVRVEQAVAGRVLSVQRA